MLISLGAEFAITILKLQIYHELLSSVSLDIWVLGSVALAMLW